MTDESDWRLLRGGEEYYSGLTLFRRRFCGRYPGDHQHCDFCWAKFMDERDPPYPGDEHVIVHEGYSPEDNVCWVCDQCFADFHVRFSWTVAPDSK